MNDKDRDLITDVLAAAGKAGEQGFTYLVNYEWMTALTDFLSCVATGLFLGYLLIRAFRWKPKEDEAYLARGVTIAVCCLVIVVDISYLFESISVMLAPEGAAIHSVLAKCKSF